MKSLPMSGALAALILSGCAGFGSPTPGREQAADPHKQYWAKYDHSLTPVSTEPAAGSSAAATAPAARPATAAAATATRAGVCSEPAPDATLKLISKLEATRADASAELDASVVRLAERTQMLSFLRESLYRVCEQSASGQMTKQEASTAYGKVMDSVHAIIETDRDRARESAARALKSLSPEQIKALQ